MALVVDIALFYACFCLRGDQPWANENSLHRVLDVTFSEGQSRLRKGFGARNMAIVRHIALNLVRTAKDKRMIKLRRTLAAWTPDYLGRLLREQVK